MNVLEDILSHKREEVSHSKVRVPRRELEQRELFSRETMSLRQALQRRTPAVIAEVKKASPSKGVIRENFDPLQIADEYVQNGAAALSVLTDEKFFQGSVTFIEQMRSLVPIPILRKDFVIDSYQLYEAKAFGADAVLLIAAALDSAELHSLLDEATSLGLECLVEVHSKAEIETLDFDKVKLVGINNRDLTTFETDLSLSSRLRESIPRAVEVVSESAIRTGNDVSYLMSSGISSFLIGETFMRAGSPGSALAKLLAESSALHV